MAFDRSWDRSKLRQGADFRWVRMRVRHCDCRQGGDLKHTDSYFRLCKYKPSSPPFPHELPAHALGTASDQLTYCSGPLAWLNEGTPFIHLSSRAWNCAFSNKPRFRSVMQSAPWLLFEHFASLHRVAALLCRDDCRFRCSYPSAWSPYLKR